MRFIGLALLLVIPGMLRNVVSVAVSWSLVMLFGEVPGTRHPDGDGVGADQHRIGYTRLDPKQRWIEQCTSRNRALRSAARALGECADLARALAEQATTLGNDSLAARLEEEARAEAHHMGQILEMLEEIGADAAEAVSKS